MTADLARIQEIVARARGNADELALIRQELANSLPAGACDGRRWEVAEFVIKTALNRDAFSELIAALNQIAPYDLGIAPRVAAAYSGDKSQVLVEQYWACPGERLLRVYDHQPKFSESVRIQFRRDIVRLADTGYMHAGAYRGVGYWSFGEISRRVVLTEWSMLRPLESREAMLESIDHYLSEYAA